VSLRAPFGARAMVRAMTEKSKARYTGELNTPIDVPSPPLALSARPVAGENRGQCDAARAEQDNRHTELIVDIQYRRIRLLAQYFGIDPDLDADAFWPRLALKLAYRHVRGFQFRGNEKLPGRPLEWSSERLQKLRITVEEVKLKIKGTDKAACAYIATNKKYKSIWGKEYTSEQDRNSWIRTLRSRLGDAKREHRQAELMIKALMSKVPS
jgi:hypothetical protein